MLIRLAISAGVLACATATIRAEQPATIINPHGTDGGATVKPGDAAWPRDIDDGCLSCHGNIENATQNMGGWLACTFCHGGDGNAMTKKAAHVQPRLPVIRDQTTRPLDYDLQYQKFVNPSDLRVVERTCGFCHPTVIGRVKKGLMATGAGHYAGGLYQNGVVDTKTPIYGNFAVTDNSVNIPFDRGAVASLQDLLTYDPTNDPSLISTHYRALPPQACARCHLWSRGKGYRGAVGKNGLYRADGCAACHMPYANDGLSHSADPSIDHTEPGHPINHMITRAIPTEQCLHCHHRGARIGLSFTGRAQMPPRLPSGPGVPGTTDERFNGNFHYVDPATNPQDIHGDRGMHCVDCHTSTEIMGDGFIYGHMDQATKIECQTCHGTPWAEGTLIDNDGVPLRNVARNKNGEAIVTSKVDSREHWARQAKDVVDPLSPIFNPRASCAMNSNHLRPVGGLECYACHSSWTANCFGCHFERDERFRGLNMMTRQWEQGRARSNDKIFVSLRQYMIGPNSSGRIASYIVGCQPIADITDANGATILDFAMPYTVNGLSGLAMQPVNPHTVRGRREVRTCAECHRAPPSLGLGSGNYAAARQHAFVTGPAGVQVLDRHTDPTQPVSVGLLSGGPALAVASLPSVVEGTADFLYVARGAAGLAIYDMRAGIPAGPTSVVEGINAIDVSRSGSELYVVTGGEGIRMYDNKDPAQATLVSIVPLPSAVRAVPWGIHLFVAAGADGLVVIDVANLAAPMIVGKVDGIHGDDVTLYAHYQMGNAFASRAYVADAGYGVWVVDLLPSFSSPRLVGGLPLPGAAGLDTYTRYLPADDVTPSREHDYLYVAAGPAGLRVFDITDPDAVIEVATAELGGMATDVDVSSELAPPGVDDYALVANSQFGLQVVDVTDPLTPVLRTTVPALGDSRVLVEVQQLDRFIDENGTPLKENSHPFVGTFCRQDIVRILGADITPQNCGCPTAAADVDGDGVVTGADIGPFVSVLLGAGQGYYACAADLNGDLSTDAGDIAPFVTCLLNGCP
ncbi:MAG: hypothetical protein ACE5F9_10095 [Phycisphaerae bacterium]